MAKHPLLNAKKGWDMSLLPSPFDTYQTRSSDPFTFSEFHPVNRSTTDAHAYVTRAVLEYIRGEESNIALIKVGEGTYAAEYELETGETLLFVLYATGQCKGTIRSAGGRHTPLKTIGGRSDVFDTTPIFMAVLLEICNVSPSIETRLEEVKKQGTIDSLDVYFFSDAVRFALEDQRIKLIMPGGNVDLLTSQMIESRALTGRVLCGTPRILSSIQTLSSGGITFQAAMQEFESWRTRRTWTEEERQLIPVFPDDYPVMPEVLKICRRYIGTHDDTIPMLNFMWRGVTSFGKSTGVEQIAAMLNLPLLRMTCSTTMETQDFLSKLIPVSVSERTAELPSFEELSCDPETAYTAITGQKKEPVTPEECLQAYAEAYASQKNQNSGPMFRHVESNFVRALKSGYLLEIQECSRIKDPGVLVGLNECATCSAASLKR